MPTKPTPHPLRHAGESARTEVEHLFTARFFYAGGIILAFLAFTASIWIDWWRDHEVSPWRQTVCAAITAIVASAFAYAGFRRARTWAQGERGERGVGEILSEVAASGYRVFHDLPFERDGARWNIDHAMVGPSGVYVIETKNWIKTAGEGERIDPDGPPAARAKAQASRNARDIAALLHDRLGEPVPARAVVLLPGRYVDERSGAEVWVLNPKRLFTWIRKEEQNGERLELAQIRRIAGVLDEAARAPLPG